MTLTYSFGKNKEDFEYRVDDEAVYGFLLNNNYITKEKAEELDYDLHSYFEDYEGEIKEFYFQEALELWNDKKEQEKNPYGYRGISPKDFY
jgi:hypothetical protein